ncbi:MAG: peptidylprolyl isomerase [Alphaproteobacteria bacterium]|nr:peptidylprolyl isomerase [Alphaproteobacteria bacterium]
MIRSPRGLRAALMLALVAAAPAFAQTPPAPAGKPAGDPVVATVNGQQVRLSEIHAAQATLPQQYRALPLDRIYPALLERVIDGKLQIAEARKAKVQDTEGYKKRLAALEEQLLQEQFVLQEIEKKVTPQALKDAYNKKVRDLPPEEEIKARHILVADEAAAKAVIEDLKKGGDFEKIAKDKSTDKASGAQGGDLGWFKKADMVKEFAEAAFLLKKGETTTAPVKSQFGYHIIRLDDRRAAQPPSMEEMEEELRAELSREAYGQLMEGLRKSAKVEKFNMDGSKMEEKPPTPPAPPAPSEKK